MNITHSIVAERDRALLGGDYNAYHAQATRRISALRRRLGNATPRGRKYSPKALVTVENVSRNAEWVQLLLASAERAWADAMAMKTSQSPENTQRPRPGSTKKQIVSRHRRAIAYATNLVEILSDTGSGSSQSDLLEAKAYLALLRGGLYFEQSKWGPCIENYAIARLTYVALGTATKRDIYKDLLSSTVDPSIKYAAYQSKLPRTKAVSDIAVEKFPTSESSTKAEIQKLDSQAFKTTADKVATTQNDTPTNLPTTITWRSRNVKIEEASVSQALGLAKDKENDLKVVFENYSKGSISNKELAAAYEEVIDARQDAVDITKDAIDELRSQGVEQGDVRIQSLQITRTAINFAVIEWRIGRNRVLCGNDDGLKFQTEVAKRSGKPRNDGNTKAIKDESSGRKLGRLRERLALYESTLQSLDAIKELPGVVADTELVSDVGNKKDYFKALKYLAIGRSHALNSNIAQALALFSKAHETVAKSKSLSKSTSNSEQDPPKLDITPNQFKALKEHLASLEMQYQALAELKGLESSKNSTENSASPPLIERFYLNQYFDDVDPKNLVNYPPKLQPVPVKPLFFDLAWNYIQYPGQKPSTVEPVVQHEPEPEEAPAPAPAKRGWFGFGR